MTRSTPRTGALDVLAQHVLGHRVLHGPFSRAELLLQEVRLAAALRRNSRSEAIRPKVVDFVSTGGYALRSLRALSRGLRPTGRWAAAALTHPRSAPSSTA